MNCVGLLIYPGALRRTQLPICIIAEHSTGGFFCLTLCNSTGYLKKISNRHTGGSGTTETWELGVILDNSWKILISFPKKSEGL